MGYHVTSTGHSLKWDHFEILAKGLSDTHCKIKWVENQQSASDSAGEFIKVHDR